MRFLFFSLSLFLLACSSSSVDAKRVPIKVALKQNNLNQLESTLYSISTPPNYGSHLSPSEIASIIGASQQDIDAVTQWLTNSQEIDADNVRIAKTRDWIMADVRESVASSLATLHLGSSLSSLLSTSSPPLSSFDFILTGNDPRLVVNNPNTNTNTKPNTHHHKNKHRSHRLRTPITEQGQAPLATSGTPAAQRAAYGVPATLTATNKNNTQMVWGPGTYGYSKSDLASYYSKYGISSANNNKVSSKGYPGVPGGDNFGEATLDTQLISGLAPGVSTIVYNTDNSSSTEEGYGFGPALLSFLSGLNDAEDADVPRVLSLSLGSLSFDSCQILCDGAVELSGGSVTAAQCSAYLQQQRQVCMYPDSAQIDRSNVEFQKLGLRGVTVTAATGDGGSHFSFQRFGSDQIGSLLNSVSCSYNLPTFPAESPFVLGVGGTTWNAPASSAKPVAWVASGSGFSWRFPVPDYQAQDVAQYVQNTKGLPSDSAFNKTNRAYPDVAALATNVPIVDGGFSFAAGGTSASAPEFAALISLINDARLNSGLQSLGFVNPRLYALNRQNPGVLFYDMSTGSSSCDSSGFCCDDGFPAAVGWDPTTGLGSPVFGGLYNFLSRDD